MKCLLSCVTYDPKLDPTIQCHVGPYFASKSFFRLAAISLSVSHLLVLYTHPLPPVETRSTSLPHQHQQTHLYCHIDGILLHFVAHIAGFDSIFRSRGVTVRSWLLHRESQAAPGDYSSSQKILVFKLYIPAKILSKGSACPFQPSNRTNHLALWRLNPINNNALSIHLFADE